jgi:hypothetical protein
VRGSGSLIKLDIVFLDIALFDKMLFSDDPTMAMARRTNTTRTMIARDYTFMKI